jgi:hypothetical protein
MDDRFEQQAGAYHFTLDGIVDFIKIYGYDVVLQDINDYYLCVLESQRRASNDE